MKKSLLALIAAAVLSAAAAIPNAASAANMMSAANPYKPVPCVKCGTAKIVPGSHVTNPGDSHRIIWQRGNGSKFAKVMLNPQPLPPKVARGAASQLDKVALNPQPLPPKVFR